MGITTATQEKLNKEIKRENATPLPGPRPWPVLGTFGNLVPFFLDPIGISNKMYKEYGDTFILVQGGGTRLFSPYPEVPMTVFTRKPEHLHQMIQSDNYEMYGAGGIFFPLE